MQKLSALSHLQNYDNQTTQDILKLNKCDSSLTNSLYLYYLCTCGVGGA